MPRTLAVELLAQAALAYFADQQGRLGGTEGQGVGPPGGPGPFLAGLEEVELLRDVVPGDSFEVEIAVEASLGQIHRLKAELRDRDGPAIRGSLLVGC